MPEHHCETLLTCRWLLPVAPENRVFENMAIAIDDGKIISVGPAENMSRTFAAQQVIDFSQHAILPGLINSHGHAAMTLLRGIGEDQALQAWLSDTIWPIEMRHMSPEFVRDGTRLAVAEMLSHGTTCFADMYFFPEIIAEVADETGMRVQVAFPVIEFPNAWSTNTMDGFHKGLRLRDRFKHHARINIGFGPHSAYTVSKPDLEQTLTYAEELDAPIQIHLHENAAEVVQAHDKIGTSWINQLHEIGMLSPRLQAVHMTATTSADLDLIAETGVNIIHCPRSNLKLASGACSTSDMLERGINLGLGTDGAASNNSLDLFGEMRLAALLAKHESGRAEAGTVASVLEMATLGGARALGIDHVTGSIEPGKAADLVAVDLSGPSFAPLYDPMVAIVHGNAGEAVSDVWIDGKRVIADKTHRSLDLKDVLDRANEWGARIQTNQLQQA